MHGKGLQRVPPASYDIVCAGFRKANRSAWTGAEFITWYIEGGLKNNLIVLHFLHGLRGQLHPGATALIAHDAVDLETPAALAPFAEYNEAVFPSRHECTTCLERLANHARFIRPFDGHVLRVVGCNRTTSIVNLIAIRIHGPQLAAFVAIPVPELIANATRASRAALSLSTGDYTPSATLGTCRFVGNDSAGNRTVEFQLPRTRSFNMETLATLGRDSLTARK